ncbi:MAG: restriction endonuclease [Bacteroidales bacterium]|nr:restriction endonuclease [Candidatus Latescibacterota bacterium]
MALSLKHSRAARDLAQVLYDFLPGSGNANWKGHVSYKTVAEKVGVGDFWQPGSKLPMITALLERTLEFRRGRFEPLILEVVRCGLTYRQKRGQPVDPKEIDEINGLILELDFKFPDLWDPEFRESLSVDGGVRAASRVKQVRNEERLGATARSARSQSLEGLKREFLSLHDSDNRQRAGLELEKILNRLFELNELTPSKPFRVTGEQIDGSFELDHEIYLFEAKWTQDPIPASDLYVFRGKIEGKSKFTRGVFLTMNGISQPALEAVVTGKQPTFFIMDGYDLMMLLEDNLPLVEFLRRRQRFLAERGKVAVQFRDLFGS